MNWKQLAKKLGKTSPEARVCEFNADTTDLRQRLTLVHCSA
jgi:hypothetical protein